MQEKQWSQFLPSDLSDGGLLLSMLIWLSFLKKWISIPYHKSITNQQLNRLKLWDFFFFFFGTSHPCQILGQTFHSLECFFPPLKKIPALSVANLYSLYLGTWNKVILPLYSHTNKTLMLRTHSTKRNEIITLIYMLLRKVNTWEFSRFKMNVMLTETSGSGFFNTRSRPTRAVVFNPGYTIGLPWKL